MNRNIFARVALLVAAIIWGSSLVVVSGTSEYFNPNMLLVLRFGIASIALCIIYYKRLNTISFDDIKSGFIVGIFLYLGYAIQTIGVTTANGLPGRSAFLAATSCVFVPFLTWFVMKIRPNKYHIIAGIICIIGVAALCFTEFSLQMFSSFTLADFLALLSGVLFAGHIVSIEVCSKGKDPVIITIIQFITCGTISLFITTFFEDNSSMILNRHSIFATLYLALFCTALALLLQNIGQKNTEPATGAIILSLEAFFGILASVIFTGETLGINSIVGFCLIFMAIIISETKLEFLKNKKHV